jgi:hypothetical protein
MTQQKLISPKATSREAKVLSGCHLHQPSQLEHTAWKMKAQMEGQYQNGSYKNTVQSMIKWINLTQDRGHWQALVTQ